MAVALLPARRRPGRAQTQAHAVVAGAYGEGAPALAGQRQQRRHRFHAHRAGELVAHRLVQHLAAVAEAGHQVAEAVVIQLRPLPLQLGHRRRGGPTVAARRRRAQLALVRMQHRADQFLERQPAGFRRHRHLLHRRPVAVEEQQAARRQVGHRRQHRHHRMPQGQVQLLAEPALLAAGFQAGLLVQQGGIAHRLGHPRPVGEGGDHQRAEPVEPLEDGQRLVLQTQHPVAKGGAAVMKSGGNVVGGRQSGDRHSGPPGVTGCGQLASAGVPQSGRTGEPSAIW